MVSVIMLQDIGESSNRLFYKNMNNLKRKSVLVGIAGGSACGKTTVALEIQEKVGKENVLVIQQDGYYRDQCKLSAKERGKLNFDEPHAFDVQLLQKHILMLLKGESVYEPIYCFKTHTRRKEKEKIVSKKIIILEGLLVLHDPRLRLLMDLRIFVDTEADTRFVRRLIRDIKKRGRTPNSIIKQYLKTVKPMHKKHVEPTRKFSDMVISGEGNNSSDIKKIISEILSLQKEMK